MKSEIESCIGNFTVQDKNLLHRHCTRQKSCTAYRHTVQVQTRGVTYSLTVERGWHESGSGGLNTGQKQIESSGRAD